MRQPQPQANPSPNLSLRVNVDASNLDDGQTPEIKLGWGSRWPWGWGYSWGWPLTWQPPSNAQGTPGIPEQGGAQVGAVGAIWCLIVRAGAASSIWPRGRLQPQPPQPSFHVLGVRWEYDPLTWQVRRPNLSPNLCPNLSPNPPTRATPWPSRSATPS